MGKNSGVGAIRESSEARGGGRSPAGSGRNRSPRVVFDCRAGACPQPPGGVGGAPAQQPAPAQIAMVVGSRPAAGHPWRGTSPAPYIDRRRKYRERTSLLAGMVSRATPAPVLNDRCRVGARPQPPEIPRTNDNTTGKNDTGRDDPVGLGLVPNRRACEGRRSNNPAPAQIAMAVGSYPAAPHPRRGTSPAPYIDRRPRCRRRTDKSSRGGGHGAARNAGPRPHPPKLAQTYESRTLAYNAISLLTYVLKYLCHPFFLRNDYVVVASNPPWHPIRERDSGRIRIRRRRAPLRALGLRCHL